jgi:hypothetical protein
MLHTQLQIAKQDFHSVFKALAQVLYELGFCERSGTAQDSDASGKDWSRCLLELVVRAHCCVQSNGEF